MTDTARRHLHNAACCLSLANVCFFHAWGLALNPGSYYFFEQPPSVSYFGALLLDVVLLAGLLFGAAAWMDRRNEEGPAPSGRLRYLVVLAIPLGQLRYQLYSLATDSAWTLLPKVVDGLYIVLLLGGAVAAIRWLRQLGRISDGLLLILSPLVVITFGQGIVRMAHYAGAPTEFETRPAPPPLERSGSVRVVWIVFDEMDEQLLFQRRPVDFGLPALDEIRRGGAVATAAMAPANETLVSLPAMISGQPYDRARPHAPNELAVWRAGEGAADRWSEAPTVFARARAGGATVGMVGWYHRYCRLFGDELDSCAWFPFEVRRGSGAEPAPWGHAMMWHVSHAIHALPPLQFLVMVGVGGDVITSQLVRLAVIQPEALAPLEAQALAWAADPELDLVVVHHPLPHPPYFDRQPDGTYVQSDANYFDNARLADDFLAGVRARVQDAGLEERTVYVITSDHPYRWDASGLRPTLEWDEAEELLATERNVPLMIYFPLRGPGVESGPVHVAHLAQLVPAILSGEVDSADAVWDWCSTRCGEPVGGD